MFIAQVRKVPLCTFLEYLVYGRVQSPNSSGDKMDSVCTIMLGVYCNIQNGRAVPYCVQSAVKI